MASLPGCTVKPPQLNHSHWSPASYMSRSNAMPHYAIPILATTPGTSPAYSRPLSRSISVSCPGYSTSSLGVIFPPTSSTINPYADEHLPMAVSSGMHPLSSVSSANGAQPIEVYGAKPLTPEFEVFNKTTQTVTSTRFGSPVTSFNGPRTLGASARSRDDGSLSGTGSGSSGYGRNRPGPPSSETLTVRTGSNKADTERSAHGNVSREVARRKPSRITNACKRCQIRKARCFGGNPCNRCIKRNLDCEFDPSPRRGHKPQPSDLTPAVGQRLRRELNPAIDVYTEGVFDPDVGNPSSASSSSSIPNPSNLSGFGTSSIVTIATSRATLDWSYPNIYPPFDMHRPVMEDGMMLSSPQGIPGSSDDTYGSHDLLFTPLMPTMPLPLPALVSQTISEVSIPSDEDSIAAMTESRGLSFSTAGSLSSSLSISEPMPAFETDRLVKVCEGDTPESVDWRSQPPT